MMLAHISALILALVCTAFGQLNYKLFFVRGKCWTNLILAVAFFCTIPICAYFALKQLAVGLVYMCTALTQLMILGLSHYVLKEKFTGNHAMALVLIISGIVLYAWPQ